VFGHNEVGGCYAGWRQTRRLYADPVEIYRSDRDTISQPIVLSGETDKALLSVALEKTDLMVDVIHQCLIGTHGDEWMRYVRDSASTKKL
jgi:hypothetical protein